MANGWMDSGIPMNTTLSNDQYWDGYQWVSGGTGNSVSSSMSTTPADMGVTGPAQGSTVGSVMGSAFGTFGESMAMGAGPLGSAALGIGAGINNALGLSSPMGVQGLASAIATAFGGPLAGAAVGMLGGFAINGVMDALDARAMEQTRDMAEEALGHGIAGLSAGHAVSSAIQGAHDAGLSAQSIGMAAGQAMADHGLASSPTSVSHGISLGMQDAMGPDIGATIAASIADDAGIAGFGTLGGLAQTGVVGADAMAVAADSVSDAAASAAAATAAAADAAAATAATGAADAGTAGTAAADSAADASADAGADAGSEGGDSSGGDSGGGGGDGGGGEGSSDGDAGSDGGDAGGDSDGGGDGE